MRLRERWDTHKTCPNNMEQKMKWKKQCLRFYSHENEEKIYKRFQVVKAQFIRKMAVSVDRYILKNTVTFKFLTSAGDKKIL